MEFDAILRSGDVYDGLGGLPQTVDVGLRGGRIAAIGDLSEARAARELDATGLAVAPGFIDIHGHSDPCVLAGPRCESKVHQGVTTELCGMCGYSPAPVSAACREDLRAGAFFPEAEFEWDWRSLDEYLDRVEAARPSMNIVQAVGHTPLRASVMGYDARPASPDELDAMGRMLAQALEEGGAGFSSGLIYPPGSFAPPEELEYLCRVAGRYGRGYYTHMRSEGDGLIDSVRETIAAARAGGVAVEIAHHKAAGRSNWGKVRDSIALIEQARNEGVDVRVDVYPYTAGSTTMTSLLPDWAHEGGREELLARLRDPETRQRLADEISGPSGFAGPPRGEEAWTRVLVAAVADQRDREFEGLTLAQVGEVSGKAPVEAMFDLLLAHETRVSIVSFTMCDEDMAFVLGHPLSTVGSDASAVSAVNGRRYGKPHPRAYGTFPRVLGRFARDQKLMPLAEAIRKMTSEPARRIGLKDRGVLREGAAADVVVFDPATIIDRATYADPHQFPDGIRQVWVNGVLVIDGGRHTGAGPGHVLRL